MPGMKERPLCCGNWGRSSLLLSLYCELAGLGGVGPPFRGVRTSSSGVPVEADWRSSMLLPVPSSRVARMVGGSAGP